MSPALFFCFYCRVPNNLQCRINSPPGPPARHKSPRQMHVRIACAQVLFQYIYLYIIYYLCICVMYARWLYIFNIMLKKEFLASYACVHSLHVLSLLFRTYILQYRGATHRISVWYKHYILWFEIFKFPWNTSFPAIVIIIHNIILLFPYFLIL